MIRDDETGGGPDRFSAVALQGVVLFAFLYRAARAVETIRSVELSIGDRVRGDRLQWTRIERPSGRGSTRVRIHVEREPIMRAGR